MNLKDLSLQNKKAWNTLYGATEALVWGESPIGFIDQFLAYVRPKLTSTSRLLDAATGEGRNIPPLLRLPGQVFACDSSINALKKIPDSIKAQVECIECDLASLPFENGYFDFVLLTDVIETLPQATLVLKELHRVLKPGGKLLCNIPGMEDSISTIDMSAISNNQYLYQGEYFYQFLSEEEAIDMLLAYDFNILDNKLCDWLEEAHPEFRSTAHTHTSRVFLLEKQEALIT